MNALYEAADRLAEMLERENSALQKSDLAASSALLHDKRACLAAFEAACASKPDTTKNADAFCTLAKRLDRAAVENKRLLERAITTQKHIMILLSRAVARTQPQARYGATGRNIRPANDPAFALISSA